MSAPQRGSRGSAYRGPRPAFRNPRPSNRSENKPNTPPATSASQATDGNKCSEQKHEPPKVNILKRDSPAPAQHSKAVENDNVKSTTQEHGGSSTPTEGASRPSTDHGPSVLNPSVAPFTSPQPSVENVNSNEHAYHQRMVHSYAFRASRRPITNVFGVQSLITGDNMHLFGYQPSNVPSMARSCTEDDHAAAKAIHLTEFCPTPGPSVLMSRVNPVVAHTVHTSSAIPGNVHPPAPVAGRYNDVRMEIGFDNVQHNTVHGTSTNAHVMAPHGTANLAGRFRNPARINDAPTYTRPTEGYNAPDGTYILPHELEKLSLGTRSVTYDSKVYFKPGFIQDPWEGLDPKPMPKINDHY